MGNILIQYAIVIFGFIFALVYSYVRGRSDSKKDLEAQSNKKKIEDFKTSKRIENEVKQVPVSDLDRKLDKWMRND